MKDFFSYIEPDTANNMLGSSEKFTSLAMLLIVLYFVFKYKNNIREYKYEHRIRYFIAGILILGEGSIHIWRLAHGEYGIETLPLHLCSFSLIFGAYALIRKSEKVHHIMFFWAIQGALQALLSPNITVGFEHYRFYQFTIVHGMLVISPLYMMWVHGYVPTFKTMVRSYYSLILFAIPIVLFNTVAGTDYMFTSLAKDARPITGSPLDLLGPQPLYIIPLFGLAFILFYITYIPIQLGYLKQRRIRLVK